MLLLIFVLELACFLACDDAGVATGIHWLILRFSFLFEMLFMLLLVLLMLCLQEGLRHPPCKATRSMHPMDKCVCCGKRPPPCRLQRHAKLSAHAVATLTANEQCRCASFSARRAPSTLPRQHKLPSLLWEEACTRPAPSTLPSHHKHSPYGQMCMLWEDSCTCQGTTSSHSMDVPALGRGQHTAKPAQRLSRWKMWLLWEAACTMQAAEPCQALTR